MSTRDNHGVTGIIWKPVEDYKNRFAAINNKVLSVTFSFYPIAKYAPLFFGPQDIFGSPWSPDEFFAHGVEYK